MTLGTRSLLFGVHQVALHPLLVMRAWVRLYGWSVVRCAVTGVRTCALDPRLWLTVVVHDLGYWGSPDMDGEEGKWHPLLGARLVSALFAEEPSPLAMWSAARYYTTQPMIKDSHSGYVRREWDVYCWVRHLGRWGLFVLLHSRSVAHRLGAEPSALCAPDKLALSMYPRSLYLALARLSGELAEYMRHGSTEAARERGIDASTPERWWDTCSAYMAEVAHRMVAGGEAGTPPEDGGAP